MSEQKLAVVVDAETGEVEDGRSLPAVRNNGAAEWTNERLELIKRTVAKGTTDDELALFLQYCKRTGLDPVVKQIYAIRRWDSKEKRLVMTIQTSIDGLRLIADRTGKYRGQEGPYWCDEDGRWSDVWFRKEPPAAAKVGVLRAGWPAPVWAVVAWREFAPCNDGKLAPMWERYPAHMLAKCAEAQALRRAFPVELEGLSVQEDREDEAPLPAPTAVVEEAEPAAEAEVEPQPSEAARREKAMREFGVLYNRAMRMKMDPDELPTVASSDPMKLIEENYRKLKKLVDAATQKTATQDIADLFQEG